MERAGCVLSKKLRKCHIVLSIEKKCLTHQFKNAFLFAQQSRTRVRTKTTLIYQTSSTKSARHIKLSNQHLLGRFCAECIVVFQIATQFDESASKLKRAAQKKAGRNEIPAERGENSAQKWMMGFSSI